MIYVASPYWHQDQSIINERMEIVYSIVAKLMRDGNSAVTPMLMHEVVLRHNLPNDFAFWGDYSFNLLKRCDELHVVTIDGWDRSRGVAEEIRFARELNIPVVFIDDEGAILINEEKL